MSRIPRERLTGILPPPPELATRTLTPRGASIDGTIGKAGTSASILLARTSLKGRKLLGSGGGVRAPRTAAATLPTLLGMLLVAACAPLLPLLPLLCLTLLKMVVPSRRLHARRMKLPDCTPLPLRTVR